MLSYLSGACRRVGFHRFNQEGLYAGDLLTHKVLHNGHIHAAHTFLDLVHALDAPPDHVPRVKRPRTTDALDVPKISTDASAAAGIWGKLRAIHADIGPARKLGRHRRRPCDDDVTVPAPGLRPTEVLVVRSPSRRRPGAGVLSRRGSSLSCQPEPLVRRSRICATRSCASSIAIAC